MMAARPVAAAVPTPPPGRSATPTAVLANEANGVEDDAPNNAPAVVNTSISTGELLREHAKQELLGMLDAIRGKKGLVIDPKLVGPLGLVVEASVLREHDVEKMYCVEPMLDTECKILIYVVRPRLQLMKFLANHIRHHAAKGQKKAYYLFFVPRKTSICEQVLQDEKVNELVTIQEYNLDLIPMDNGVLSLELESSYREVFLDGDRTSLFNISRALMKLQAVFGVIPHIKGKGAAAKLVFDMLQRMRREMRIEETQPKPTPEIDMLILIDRHIDMVTPMLTQRTYHGLIDEIFGIQNNMVTLDPDLVPTTDSPTQTPVEQRKPIKIPLNSKDRLFADVKDIHFSALGPALTRKTTQLTEFRRKWDHLRGNAGLTQIKEYAKHMKQHKADERSVSLHTNIASKIIEISQRNALHRHMETEQNIIAGSDSGFEYIEESIYKHEPLVKVLRLLVLHSLTNGGLKPSKWEELARDILQTYGHEYIFTLDNLLKLDLLRRQTGPNPFPALRKQLHLLTDLPNIEAPSDISYVYSGYAPIGVRLVQRALAPGGWRAIEDAMRQLPGPTFEETIYRHEPVPGRRPVILVFYIGGITYAEITALRSTLLTQQEAEDSEIVVATTKLVNGNTLLESLVENLENNYGVQPTPAPQPTPPTKGKARA